MTRSVWGPDPVCQFCAGSGIRRNKLGRTAGALGGSHGISCNSAMVIGDPSDGFWVES
jgi:hypothetical protein